MCTTIMQLGECKITVRISGLSIKVVANVSGVECTNEQSLYYVKGHFLEAPSLCIQTETEFYSRFYIDNGATYVRFGNRPIMVIGLRVSLAYLKVFIDSDGLVGGILVTRDKHVYYSSELAEIVAIERIGGELYVKCLQR